MNNESFMLIDISKQLKRIADAIEESNRICKELSGK